MSSKHVSCRRSIRHSSEKVSPTKGARNSASAVSGKSLTLNAKTLKSHTVREGYVDIFELIGLESDNVRASRGSKRSVSKARTEVCFTTSTGIGAVETASQVTQKSFTAAHYRLSTLAGANIVFRFSHVPEDVCIRIAAIVQRPISMERKRELSRIAHTLHDQFAPILDGAASKEDCVGLFHQALSALGYSDSLLLQRKAGMVP